MNVRAVLVGCVVAFPFFAEAAEFTRLASSFEENDPFGMYLDLAFERTQTRSLLTREVFSGSGDPTSGLVDQPELRYEKFDSRVRFDAKIGIWQDLELRYSVPLIFQHSEHWNYASDVGFDGATSSVRNNCVDSRGNLVSPGCDPTTGAGSVPLFPVPSGAYRTGFGNMTFGLAYAFFNQKKDDTKPTWVFGLDYEAPTAERLDASVPTRPGDKGKVGDRIHKYKLWTAFSRQMGVADPYFRLWYQIPARGPGWYSNCSSPVPASMGYVENCFQGPWTKDATGIQYPHMAGVDFGNEFEVYNDKDKQTRWTLDLRLHGNYVGKGRYYNELSGQTLKMMDTSDYLQVGGDLGVYVELASFFRLKASSSLSYNTDHLLTDAAVGQDLDGNGEVDLPGNPSEVNPNFDFRMDAPGRRFRATETSVFHLELGAELIF